MPRMAGTQAKLFATAGRGRKPGCRVLLAELPALPAVGSIHDDDLTINLGGLKQW